MHHRLSALLGLLGLLALAACGTSDTFTRLYGAAPDAYDAIGNTTLTVSAASGLLANDGGGSVDAYDGTTTAGGVIVATPNGAFLYLPPAGFVGADTFEYSNGSLSATVTITVAEKVWYIDNTAAPGGTGTLALPFASLTEFSSVNGMGGAADPAAGDTVYLAQGSGIDYDGGIVLIDNQILLGAGVELMVGGMVLAPAGTRPVITNTNLGGDGILLGSGCTVRGLDVEGTDDVGIGGASIAGPIVINDVAVRNTGDTAILFESCTGTITVGDAAAPDVLIDAPGQDGIEADGSFPTLQVLGVEVLQANAAIYAVDTNMEATNCFCGTDATGSVGAVQSGVLIDHGSATAMAVSLTNIEVRDAAETGVDVVADGSSPLTLTCTNLDVQAVMSALITDDTGSLDQLRLAFTGCTFTSGPGEQAVFVNGNIIDSTTVVAFGDTTVSPADGGGGMTFNVVSFDADPHTAGVQQVMGGSVLIGGDAANRVQGFGLRFDDPTGDLALANLAIFNNAGTGLHVDTKNLGTVFNLDVSGGSINTTGAPALFLDPPAHLPPLSLDITLDSIRNAPYRPDGILIDNARGRFRVREPLDVEMVVRNADDLAIELMGGRR